MARISGINIPLNKRVEIGLTYIFGIGRSTAEAFLRKGMRVAIGDIDCGEKRVEVLDIRVLRIKAAAQQTTDTEPRSDACK